MSDGKVTLEGTLLDIKKELRASMNGIASASMRQTEDYRVNFGVELPRIASIAQEFAPSRELAQTLWHERVRECRILATMLMPVEDFSAELADIWVTDIRTAELAQLFCINLMQKVPYAGTKAFEWIATDSDMLQMCGYLTLCHVIRRFELREDAVNELVDQASCVVANYGEGVFPPLFRAACNALQILASLNVEYAERVKKVADYLL